ncbi:MAG: hypothetical protein WC467_00565 [Patescibacteria group bacterium]
MKYFSDVYKKETKMCARMFKEKQGCAWGKCATCGVVPLLYKLETGSVVDNEEDIKALKEEVLNSKEETLNI